MCVAMNKLTTEGTVGYNTDSTDKPEADSFWDILDDMAIDAGVGRWVDGKWEWIDD